MYGAIVVNIIISELTVLLNSKFIVEIPPRKIQVEIGLIKIKYTIVVDPVNTCFRIVNPKCVVAKCRIKLLLKWPAGDHIDFCSPRQLCGLRKAVYRKQE